MQITIKWTNHSREWQIKSLKIFAFHGKIFQTSGSSDKIFVFMALRRRKKWWPPEWFRVFSKKSALHGLVNEVPVAFSSVQFSRSVVSNSFRPHELQQPGLPVHWIIEFIVFKERITIPSGFVFGHIIVPL